MLRGSSADSSQSLPVRQFLLGNLHRQGGAQKFKVPLKILANTLDNLGDFPYKHPSEVRFLKPALFIRGTRSKYVPDEAIPLIGQFFPMFEMADIDAGHWVISEQPEAFRKGMCRTSFGWGEVTDIPNSCGGVPEPERVDSIERSQCTF